MMKWILYLLLYIPSICALWYNDVSNDLFWDASTTQCPYGYYDNFYNECKSCSSLRQQYSEAKCCYETASISTPFKYVSLHDDENQTSYQMLYTPIREICNHLRKEWGKCPKQCDIHLPGHTCNRSTQCIGTRTCLNGRCCKSYDIYCVSCDFFGMCNACNPPYRVNATGTKCGICPPNRYVNNGVCFYPTNCTAGQYIQTNYNSTSDRVCSDVPNGTYTNITNAALYNNHSNCTSENITLNTLGNATHDTTCRDTLRCPPDKLFVNKVWGKDDNCTNRTTCKLGEYIIEGNYTFDNICTICKNGTFANTTNLESCYPHNVCEGLYKYTFYGNTTHDVNCLYYLYCGMGITCLN